MRAARARNPGPFRAGRNQADKEASGDSGVVGKVSDIVEGIEDKLPGGLGEKLDDVTDKLREVIPGLGSDGDADEAVSGS